MTKHRVSLTVYRSRVLRHRGNLPDQPHARVRPLKKSTGPRAGAGLCGGRRERDGWTGRQTMCTSSMCVRVTERECECVCLCVHACTRQLCSGLVVDRPQAREKLALETGTRASRIASSHQNLAGPTWAGPPLDEEASWPNCVHHHHRTSKCRAAAGRLVAAAGAGIAGSGCRAHAHEVSSQAAASLASRPL